MKRSPYIETPLLLLFAVFVISLFSTCSFLYPLNPWDDANVFMTIGNAMLSGRELYVDIFDHKGPMLNGTFPVSVLEMADIINANESEDSEVLTFSSYDTGIYQYTRHLPPNKNYFLCNILDPAIRKEQADLVASGRIKYLVRVIGSVNTCHDYYDMPVPENYYCIYDHEELFRYKFIWKPCHFLWNLTWPRVFLKHFMEPDITNQRMQIYERRP